MYGLAVMLTMGTSKLHQGDCREETQRAYKIPISA
jgi:hypothetical protein